MRFLRWSGAVSLLLLLLLIDSQCVNFTARAFAQESQGQDSIVSEIEICLIPGVDHPTQITFASKVRRFRGGCRGPCSHFAVERQKNFLVLFAMKEFKACRTTLSLENGATYMLDMKHASEKCPFSSFIIVE